MQPNDPDAQMSLANALFEKKRIDEAMIHYQKALAIRPDNFLARYRLCHTLLEKGEIDGAIQHCRAALLIRPDEADCHTLLAAALEAKGLTQEAIAHCEKAVEFSPRSVAARTNLAWLLATSPDASSRNGARAVELTEQVDGLSDGTNALVLRTLAAAYAETGQFGKAIETARSAKQFARMQGDNSLATTLEREIALYELGLPYRETRK
jgi:protein O-mannosyl-transferase